MIKTEAQPSGFFYPNGSKRKPKSRLTTPLHPETFVTKVCVQKDDYNEQRNEIKTQPKAEIIKETSKTGRAIASFQDPQTKKTKIKNVEPSQ